MPSDADLVREARRGDKEAMAELLRRHWDIAVLLAGRMLSSPDLAAEAADPALAAESADTAARVRGAIAELADGQQDAVRLFYLQGLSHREVAAELGISIGAVKARLHQARAALAPRLTQFTAFPEVRTVTATEQAAEWVEVAVWGVRATADEDLLQRQYCLILAERGGDRWLPIWIGPAEATALALALESAETPRPFTYKLAAGLVEACESRITEVKITRLLERLFYAVVVVQGPGGLREVDARPSDAVNLAVASGAPIRLDSELFTAASAYADARNSPSCPVTTADIVADIRQRRREAAQHRAQRSGPQPGGGGPQDTDAERPPAG